jgi:hypothetical protein
VILAAAAGRLISWSRGLSGVRLPGGHICCGEAAMRNLVLSAILVFGLTRTRTRLPRPARTAQLSAAPSAPAPAGVTAAFSRGEQQRRRPRKPHRPSLRRPRQGTPLRHRPVARAKCGSTLPAKCTIARARGTTERQSKARTCPRRRPRPRGTGLPTERAADRNVCGARGDWSVPGPVRPLWLKAVLGRIEQSG